MLFFIFFQPHTYIHCKKKVSSYIHFVFLLSDPGTTQMKDRLHQRRWRRRPHLTGSTCTRFIQWSTRSFFWWLDLRIFLMSYYIVLCIFYFNVCMYFIYVSVANYGAALELLDQPVERAHLLLSPRWIVWISPYPGIDPCIHTCFLK